jgi:TPR repeat protein
MLGALYENGIANNGNRDSAQAAAWIRKSAEQGYAKAQLAFGLMLAGDLAKYGVEKDEAQGAAWLRKAADQGNADAQYWLGRFYAQGHGVEKDRDQAP